MPEGGSQVPGGTRASVRHSGASGGAGSGSLDCRHLQGQGMTPGSLFTTRWV